MRKIFTFLFILSACFSYSQDTTPPEITCPDFIDVDNDLGACGAVVRFITPTATDDTDSNPTVTQTNGLPSGSEFPIGASTIVFTATDASGNTATCTLDILVTDAEAPVIACLEDYYFEADDTTGVYTIPSYFHNGMVTVTDNCSGNLILTQDPPPGTILGVGNPYPIELTAEDEEGNITVCVFYLIATFFSIDDNQLNKTVNMFPNPSSGEVRVNTQVSSVKIYNLLGQKILTSDKNVFNVSELKAGSYMVLITTETGSVTKQLVVK